MPLSDYEDIVKGKLATNGFDAVMTKKKKELSGAFLTGNGKKGMLPGKPQLRDGAQMLVGLWDLLPLFQVLTPLQASVLREKDVEVNVGLEVVHPGVVLHSDLEQGDGIFACPLRG